MTAPPFGIDPVIVLSALNLGMFIGWSYTLILYRRTIKDFERSNFWWRWWVETAVRHGIVLRDDDLEAARELSPDEETAIAAQVSAVTDDPAAHFTNREEAGEYQ